MTFANLPPTAELQASDAAHHLHPFTDTLALNKKGARVIARADGVYLWDSDGHQILDAMAGLWCVNIGYGRSEIGAAIARQSAELAYYNTFFQTTHPPAVRLAELLAELTPPHLNRVFFASSGSEANDTVVRLVRHYFACQGKPGKSIIVGRKNGYHGSTMASASLGGMTTMHAQGGMPIPDVTHIGQPYWYAEGRDSDQEAFGLARARELETLIESEGAERIAAFIAEPIQGAGGVIIPPASYWPEIQRICRHYDVLLVADEVICGFGRTGAWFGSETLGIEPDVLVFAKGVTSGYVPLGGVMISDDMAAQFIEHGGEFQHGYTYSGHPAACAGAIANLELLRDEGIVERAAADVAPYLAKAWQTLRDHPLVGEARTCGFLGAIELTPEKSTRAPFATKEGTVGLLCRDHCFANGLVMRSVRDSMVISPPLIITRAQVDELIEKAGQALDATLHDANAAGLV
ncbi:MAG: aspartate aminotransferase family protein [Pseudomonadota bacterium]